MHPQQTACRLSPQDWISRATTGSGHSQDAFGVKVNLLGANTTTSGGCSGAALRTPTVRRDTPCRAARSHGLRNPAAHPGGRRERSGGGAGSCLRVVGARGGVPLIARCHAGSRVAGQRSASRSGGRLGGTGGRVTAGVTPASIGAHGRSGQQRRERCLPPCCAHCSRYPTRSSPANWAPVSSETTTRLAGYRDGLEPCSPVCRPGALMAARLSRPVSPCGRCRACTPSLRRPAVPPPGGWRRSHPRGA